MAGFLIGLHSSAAETNSSQWQSVAANKALNYTLLEPSVLSSNKPLPVIVYLKNLATRRVGTEGDSTILQDFHNAGYLVVAVDFAHLPQAHVPYINRDLGKLRDDLRAKKFLKEYRLDDAHIYLVPEGCRLKRDVLYYPDDKRPLSLDIIYPSHPAKPVGAVIEFSCDNMHRYGNASLSTCSDTILDAEATEGLAICMADHPVAPPYKGLDAMPDCVYRIKAGVRTLRAEGAELGLNGKIAPFGFSRGSGMALMLVTTAGMGEFEGHGNHTNVSSSVEGAVVMSGRFTYLDLLPNDHMIPRYEAVWGKKQEHQDVWKQAGALDYLDHATLPLFLSINCTESADALHQMTVLRDRLAALHSVATFALDPEPRGHKVPLVPNILGPLNVYLKKQVN